MFSFKKNHVHYETIASTSDFTVGGSKRGRPSPEDLDCFPPPNCSSSPSSPTSQVKKIVTHRLCVRLNKIYILLSLLFSFFHVSSLILHIKAPWQGPATEMPPSLRLAETWGSLGRKLGRKGGAHRAGDGPQGSGGLQAQLASSWVFGWSLEHAGVSRSRTPRSLLPASCFYWADDSRGLPSDLRAGELPLPGPPAPKCAPFAASSRPRGAEMSEVRESTQVQLPGGTASLMRQEGGCPRRQWAAAGGPGCGR